MPYDVQRRPTPIRPQPQPQPQPQGRADRHSDRHSGVGPGLRRTPQVPGEVGYADAYAALAPHNQPTIDQVLDARRPGPQPFQPVDAGSWLAPVPTTRPTPTSTTRKKPPGKKPHPESIAGRLGRKGVRPIDAELSFTLPGGRQLADKLTTAAATRVRLYVSSTRLQMAFTPGLHIRNLPTLADMRLHMLDWTFAGGSVDSVSISYESFGISAGKGTAKKKVAAQVTALMGKTPFGKAGYDPFLDRNLLATLSGLGRSLRSGGSKRPKVRPAEVGKVQAGATFQLTKGFRLVGKDGGLVARPGAVVGIKADLQGSLADLASAKTPKIRRVALSSSNLVLNDGKRDVAILSSVEIHPGGIVEVKKLTPLGSLRKAATAESALRLLVLLLSLQSTEPFDRHRLAGPTPDIGPRGVMGHAAQKMSAALTKAFQDIITDNACVLNGLDLRTVLGMPTTKGPPCICPI